MNIYLILIMNNKIKTSSRSNAYNTMTEGATFDPEGVALSLYNDAGYKHFIPSGLLNEIMENLKRA